MATQKSASVVKTYSRGSRALGALPAAATPARWYSPTRRSKKLALPCRGGTAAGAQGAVSGPPQSAELLYDSHRWSGWVRVVPVIGLLLRLRLRACVTWRESARGPPSVLGAHSLNQSALA